MKCLTKNSTAFNYLQKSQRVVIVITGKKLAPHLLIRKVKMLRQVVSSAFAKLAKVGQIGPPAENPNINILDRYFFVKHPQNSDTLP